MVPRFLGFAKFERNCKMPDPPKVSILVHLSRGLLVKKMILKNFKLITLNLIGEETMKMGLVSSKDKRD